MEKFKAIYSKEMLAYIVCDTSKRMSDNSTGHPVIHGTDNVYKDKVMDEANKMNSNPDYVKTIYGIY